ncbi:MAG: hypothetical protein ACRD6N_12535 [Pyrinomonadaceae bacterium]
MPTKVFSAFKNGPHDVPSNLSTIGSLTLPPGKYAIFAKLFLEQGSSNTNKVQPNKVSAKLEAGPDFDVSSTLIGLAVNGNPFLSNAETISLNVVHEFKNGGSAVVKLDKLPDTTPHLTWSFLKITAFQVDTLTNTGMP